VKDAFEITQSLTKDMEWDAMPAHFLGIRAMQHEMLGDYYYKQKKFSEALTYCPGPKI